MRGIAAFLLGCVMVGSLSVDARAEQGPWEIAFEPQNGLSLRYDGVPVTWKSTLYVVKPGWTGLHYDQRATEYRRSTLDGGGVELIGENEVFRATYRIEPVDARQLRMRFEGRLLQDVPADIEYNIGYFNAELFSGRPFRAQTPRGEAAGSVPVFPATANQRANDLAPEFRSIEFDSRIGPMRLEIDAGEQRVMFFDARRDVLAWAPGAPIFWCGLGVPERSIRYGQPLVIETVITFDPSPARQRGEPVQVQPAVEESPHAQSQRDLPVLVIP